MDVSNWVDWNLGACFGKMGFVDGFLCRKTSKLAGDFIGSVFAYFVPLFIVFVRKLFRIDEKNSSCSLATPVPIKIVDASDSVVKSDDSEAAEFFSDDSSEEEEPPKLVFKFQSYTEFCKSKADVSAVVFQPLNFCKFLEQSDDVEFDVKESSVSEKVETLESVDDCSDGVLKSNAFVQQNYEDCFHINRSEGEHESETSENMVSEDEMIDTSCANESITDGFLSDGDFIPDINQCIEEDESSLESLEHNEL